MPFLMSHYPLAVLVLALPLLTAQPKAAGAYKQWSVVAGGPEGTRFSALRQINRTNVHKLVQAWRFDSGDEYEGSELQCNPIIVDGILYAATPRLRIVALDAATGKLLWDFDPRKGQRVTGKQRNRGLVYWTDGTERRLFFGVSNWLYSLDARTGETVKGFGVDGRIDLREGLGREPSRLTIQANSPGIVYRDLLVLGTLTSEDLPSAPGHIRAFDVRTGKFRWMFRTIPQPGEFGYDTWPKDDGSTRAARTPGRDSRSTNDAGSYSFQPGRRRSTSTALTARVTIYSQIVCSLWTQPPASASGIFNLCGTMFGIATYPPLQHWCVFEGMGA